jgi:hypothetical protein
MRRSTLPFLSSYRPPTPSLEQQVKEKHRARLFWNVANGRDAVNQPGDELLLLPAMAS